MRENTVTTEGQSNRRTPRVDLVAVAVMVAATLSSVVALGLQYIDSRENVASRCIVDVAVPGIALREDALVHAEVTALPVGRLCVWHAEAGGYVTQQTGWPITIITIALVCLALVAGIYLFRTNRRWLSTSLFAVVAGIWALIIVGAT